MAQQILSTNTFCEAKFVVDANASQGGYTTIAAALTAATSGSTIFIRPGTYTENLTLKAGVNLTAFSSDSSSNGTGVVVILGMCTMTTAGTVSISNIQLQTNSAALLAVTGSAASIVHLNNCYLNCTNTTGITFSSSNAAASIGINYCKGDIGTTGISLYSSSSIGNISVIYSTFTTTGGSSTVSTNSAGLVQFNWSQLNAPISTTSTGALNFFNSTCDTSATNTTSITANGSGGGTCDSSLCSAGSASTISIGTGVIYTVARTFCSSSNTNSITGAGTINYSAISFGSTSNTINTTTKTIAGTLQGSKNTAPTAGFLGEQIRATLGAGAATTLTNATAKTVISITLTPGIWDISAVIGYSGTVTGTQSVIDISTTDNTLGGTAGDSQCQIPLTSNVSADLGMSIPSYRVTPSTSTTYYLIAFAAFTVGTYKAYGRLSGTRVG